MLFRNTLKELYKQQREGLENPVPQGKGPFSWSCVTYPSQWSPLWWVPWGHLPAPGSLLLLLGH